MYEKQAFYKLEIKEQNRLRSFMVILSIVMILFTLTAAPSESYVFKVIGVVLNLVVIFGSIFIMRAPNLYFQLFIWVAVINVFFNGSEIYLTISHQQPFTLRILFDVLSVGLVLTFTPLIIKHRKYIAEVKKAAIIASQELSVRTTGQEGKMDFRELIPELSDWNDGKGIDIDSWIMTVGNIKYAIGYIHLLWKDFIEYDGCIFRTEAFDVQNYRKWLAATKGDKTAVEKVMNHLHLYDLFQKTDETNQQIIYMAGKMKELWECKLAKDFSNLHTVVELYDEDCQITVYLKRD